VTSDTAVKLAAVGGGLLLIAWVINRGASAASGVLDSAGAAFSNGVSSAADFVGTRLNPASDQNLMYGGVNAVGGAITGTSDFSLGSWLYDVINPEPAPVTSGGGGQFNGHGASGSWAAPAPSVYWVDLPDWQAYVTAGTGGASGAW
jgi:hypothetical protein